MSLWGQITAGPFRVAHTLHLDSIRTRIVAFTLAAGLIPALATSCANYRQNRRSVEHRITQELTTASTEAARDMDQWLAARLADLRVSVSSYVVWENQILVGPRTPKPEALSRLRDYLNSVRGRFPDQEALSVMDAEGRTVATSSGRTGRPTLPLQKIGEMRTGDAAVGEPYWDATLDKPALVFGVPIRGADGRFLGVLAAKVSLLGAADRLRRLPDTEARDIYLVTDQGRMVIGASNTSAEFMRTRLPDSVTRTLFDAEGQRHVYRRAGENGPEIVGAARRIPLLRSAAVAELPRGAVQREVRSLRVASATGMTLAFVGVGVVAWILGMVIAGPVERLTRAAGLVASGDLSVELPGGGPGEIGYLARVFNTLVARLREREKQGELEHLSVTDALTGLYNRRHLMGVLATESQRSRRLRRQFTILLMDVDHFKQYNDTHGHVAGDAALVKVADILRQTTRGVDCVARYGGEEFLVVLLETTMTTAAIVAERIRARVEAGPFEGGRVTVSVGIAECPTNGDTPESLIESADAAMYEAKHGGRNRLAVAGVTQEVEKDRRGRRKKEA